jgi:DNA-directed RNA polymerase alpha subunit
METHSSKKILNQPKRKEETVKEEPVEQKLEVGSVRVFEVNEDGTKTEVVGQEEETVEEEKKLTTDNWMPDEFLSDILKPFPLIVKALSESGYEKKDQIKSMTKEELTKIKGIGSKSADKIIESLNT